jgi:hypothetical protein
MRSTELWPQAGQKYAEPMTANRQLHFSHEISSSIAADAAAGTLCGVKAGEPPTFIDIEINEFFGCRRLNARASTRIAPSIVASMTLRACRSACRTWALVNQFLAGDA